MKQGRLPIATRICSEEELDLQDAIQGLHKKAKSLRKQKEARRKELRKQKERQEDHGLRTGEIQITEEFIQDKLQIFDDQIKRIQKDVAKLEKIRPKLTKESQKQKSLGL